MSRFAVATAGVVTSAIALFRPDSAAAPPDVQVNNSITLPEVNGSPGQTDPNANAGDSVCNDGAEKISAGWGPERPIYRGAASPYVTINSVNGNELLGDERGFYGIKDTADVADGTSWHGRMKVERDHTYTLRISVVNDADDLPHNTTKNTKVMVSLPTCTGKQIPTNAFVVSYDSFPIKVWGGVTLEADENFNLAYVEGSARLYPFGTSATVPNEGIPLTPDLLTQKGQLVGSAAGDGRLRAGPGNAVVVMFEVRPQFAPR